MSTGSTAAAGVARVQTYGDVLEDVHYQPGAKSLGPDGRPCGRGTVGLLRRRGVQTMPELLAYVGRESNRLEEVEAGLGHDPDDVYSEYADVTRDPWQSLVLPVLKHIPAKRIVEETGLAMSTVKATRNAHAVPRDRNRETLIQTATKYAREQLRERGVEPPADDLACCAAFLVSESGLQSQ